MESQNFTNHSGQSINGGLAGPGLGVFLIIFFFLSVFGFGLITVAVIILCKVSSVAKILRIFLISLLLSELVVVTLDIIACLLAAVLNFTQLNPPSPSLCRVILLGYNVGIYARLYNLAVFSVVVLMMVRYHKRQFKPLYTILGLMFIWTMPVLLNVYIIVPPIYGVQYFDNVVCFPATVGINPVILNIRYTFTAIVLVVGAIIPIFVSITAPSIGLCFIRKTEESAYKKAITKLTFLLLIGHVNIIGQIAVGLITSYNTAPGVYVVYSMALVSIVSTPIFILLYIEQVRSKLMAFILCASESLKMGTYQN